jgi:adenine-specific DNA-methyltransferase
MKVREMYNHPEPPMRDPKLLYLLILYGFNQQIRFNSNHDFNNPVGESSFNHFIFEKLISFSRVIKEKKAIFRSDDFEELISEVDKNTIVYCDPPYLITLGSYNDGKRGFNGWNETDEKRLLNFLDRVDSLKGKFMLSNVLEHKGQENTILIDWLNQNQNRYFIKHYDGNNSRNRREIIITNYSI